jgi:ribonuclease G
MIAAAEIARQLRHVIWADIVDFIDCRILKIVKYCSTSWEEMSDDKAKHKILPPSKFGLVQITRQRISKY